MPTSFFVSPVETTEEGHYPNLYLRYMSRLLSYGLTLGRPHGEAQQSMGKDSPIPLTLRNSDVSVTKFIWPSSPCMMSNITYNFTQ